MMRRARQARLDHALAKGLFRDGPGGGAQPVAVQRRRVGDNGARKRFLCREIAVLE